jgi:amidohydrolase
VPADLLQSLLGSLEDELPGAALRERLHASPEPSHKERATASLVAEALGPENVERIAGTGLVARVGPPEDAVAVRAELDALPIAEETGAHFAAANGYMHACGHDVHMAALAVLVRAVGRTEPPKSLLALYQPSEETYPSGADLVVREGVLTAEATAVVAAHVHPDVPWGSVSVEPGPVNASCDYLRIVVEGSGGHGAYPHRAPRSSPSPTPSSRSSPW